MKKKYRKYVSLSCFLLIIIIVSLVVKLSASTSVKDCDDFINSFGDSQAYALGYNLYGVRILKNPEKALKQFKKEYAEGFQYLREVRGYPELTSSYESVKKYTRIGFGGITEDIENYDEVNRQKLEIMIFAKLLKGSYWQSYGPFDTLE